MKNIGMVILFYNLITISIIHTNWYAEYNEIIDLFDIPLYIIASVVLIKNKLTDLQRNAIITSFILLLIKLIDVNIIELTYGEYVGWTLFIITLFIIYQNEKLQ